VCAISNLTRPTANNISRRRAATTAGAGGDTNGRGRSENTHPVMMLLRAFDWCLSAFARLDWPFDRSAARVVG
jgi:hypothetical protein